MFKRLRQQRRISWFIQNAIEQVQALLNLQSELLDVMEEADEHIILEGQREYEVTLYDTTAKYRSLQKVVKAFKE
jgi:hypothetical protein